MKRMALMLIGVVLLSHVAMGVDIELITIGNAGNAPHSTGYGSVGYRYDIGKYEVTTAQYTEFLNAIAATDTYGLWRPEQDITQGGSPGSWTYTTVGGRENHPIDGVQLRDCMRFVNWLHNGQPSGAQDDSTTEDGAYDLPGHDPNSSTVREADWVYALPTRDEWYKAAYYNSGTASYYEYPTSSDTKPGHEEDGSPNNACFVDFPGWSQESDMFPVGTYTASASPYGVFDMAGNASERTEEWHNSEAIYNIGGRFNATPDAFEATTAHSQNSNHWFFHPGNGMRVVAVPPPPPPPAGTIVIIE